MAPCIKGFVEEATQNLNVAVLGLGGRAQIILAECLRLEAIANKKLRVVAICDNHADESFAKYAAVLEWTTDSSFLDKYRRIFETSVIYPDNEEGLKCLFKENPHLDRIIIASTNNRHYDHITSALNYSSCKDIFLEKPLFKSLKEYESFGMQTNQAQIHVGLVLRYAPMTKIIADRMQEFKDQLGELQKVHSKEHIEFAKGMTLFMMNWRRSHSVSGGLLLDKSVHDLDLAFFFMQLLDIQPKSLNITTQFSHDFFKKSNQNLITKRVLTDHALQQQIEYWRNLPYQRIVNFSYTAPNEIDWENTFTSFFDDFPANDDFTSSDLIPDHQTVFAEIQTNKEQTVEFSHDVKFNEFSIKPQREIHFIFENGEVIADIANSKLAILRNEKTVLEEDLCTNHVTHAGGNPFVSRAILGILPPENYAATFNDPIVQLSNLIALISEDQVLHHESVGMQIVRSDGRWMIEKERHLSDLSLLEVGK